MNEPERRASIAVVLPNYDHGKLIGCSLRNLAGQTVPPDEIIVIDDASTDDSLKTIEQFQQSLPQMRIVRNVRNMGVNASVNAAVREVSSDFVVCTAADDYLEVSFTEKMKHALHSFPQARLCVSQYVEHIEATDEMRVHGVNDDGGIWYTNQNAYFGPAEFRSLLEQRYIWLPINAAVLHTQTFLAHGGYDSSLKWHSDWFLTYSIAFRHGFAVVPEQLSVFRVAAGTYSAGARQRTSEREVSLAIYQKLSRPEFADIREALRTHPAAFTPFFHDMVVALSARPDAWPFLASLMRWWFGEFLRGRRPGPWRDFIGSLR
jgi:glycosyltransferase involved in cell wall biosynthesis